MGHGVRSDQEAARTSTEAYGESPTTAPGEPAHGRADHNGRDVKRSQLQAPCGTWTGNPGNRWWRRRSRPAPGSVHMSTRLLPVFELQGDYRGALDSGPDLRRSRSLVGKLCAWRRQVMRAQAAKRSASYAWI